MDLLRRRHHAPFVKLKQSTYETDQIGNRQQIEEKLSFTLFKTKYFVSLFSNSLIFSFNSFQSSADIELEVFGLLKEITKQLFVTLLSKTII